MTLYALACEGYDKDYRQKYGGDNRFDLLKCGIEIKLKDIPSYFSDSQALEDLRSFRLWKDFGFPRANWGECPYWYIQLVQTLKELDDFYHPQVRLV